MRRGMGEGVLQQEPSPSSSADIDRERPREKILLHNESFVFLRRGWFEEKIPWMRPSGAAVAVARSMGPRFLHTEDIEISPNRSKKICTRCS